MLKVNIIYMYVKSHAQNRHAEETQQRLLSGGTGGLRIYSERRLDVLPLTHLCNLKDLPCAYVTLSV